MLYVIYCTDDPSVSARIRAEFLDVHINYLKQHADILLLGGARLAEDGKTRLGSTLVLNVASLEHALRFSENEPLRKAGLYSTVEITRMRRAQWYPANVPETVDGN